MIVVPVSMAGSLKESTSSLKYSNLLALRFVKFDCLIFKYWCTHNFAHFR